MTNKEAIEHLKNINSRYPCSLDSTFRDECEMIAINLAIKALEEHEQGKFECRIKIKDLIAMLLEFDMNEKATICTTDEYNENNIVISITDMRGKEE